jgi:hypothetical protein
MRHRVLCRASQSAPESYIVLEYAGGGEDGAQWAQNPALSGNLKTAVHQIVDGFQVLSDGGVTAHLEPDILPCITITNRDRESVIAEPPLTDYLWRAEKFMPEISITLLAPIRFEIPARTRFEMWAHASRHANRQGNQHGLSSDGWSRFIHRELRTAVLKQFNDESVDRPQFSQELYRDLARKSVVAGVSEIWIRPNWQLIDWPWFDTVFPAPKVHVPLLTPEQEKAKADRAEFVRKMNNNRRALASQGFVRNAQRGSWSKPSE